MGNLTYIFIVIQICLLPVESLCQGELKPVGRFINFNFQNEIRIEWPAGIPDWNHKHLNKSIQLNESYVDFIMNNLDEIQFEVNTGSSLDVRVYKYRGLIKLDIHKSLKPVSYLYKDSLLIFTGMNVIHLIDEQQPPVSIFFDSPNALRKLKDINYQNIFSRLKLDLEGKTILSNKELNRTSELIYRQLEDEMIYVGQLKDQTKVVYALNSIWGLQIVPDKIGIALMPEFGILKYSINKEGVSAIKSKHSFQLRAFLFDEINSIQTKYAYLRSIRMKSTFDLLGFGFGVFHTSNSENEFQYGASYSFIGESRHLWTELEFGLPFVNWTFWPNINITIGLKF